MTIENKNECEVAARTIGINLQLRTITIGTWPSFPGGCFTDQNQKMLFNRMSDGAVKENHRSICRKQMGKYFCIVDCSAKVFYYHC